MRLKIKSIKFIILHNYYWKLSTAAKSYFSPDSLGLRISSTASFHLLCNKLLDKHKKIYRYIISKKYIMYCKSKYKCQILRNLWNIYMALIYHHFGPLISKSSPSYMVCWYGRCSKPL